jgi:DNA-binding XRE family transcriptional regulator
VILAPSHLASIAAQVDAADVVMLADFGAAQGWMGWSQEDLANRASVSLSTVRDFEKGRRTPIVNNLNAVQRVLAEAGIECLFGNERAVGIRLIGSGSPDK